MNKTKVNSRKIILVRAYVVLSLLVVFVVAIFVAAIKLQMGTDKAFAEQMSEKNTRIKEVEALRGNIYADDGSLLATSVPKYDLDRSGAAPGAGELRDQGPPSRQRVVRGAVVRVRVVRRTVRDDSGRLGYVAVLGQCPRVDGTSKTGVPGWLGLLAALLELAVPMVFYASGTNPLHVREPCCDVRERDVRNEQALYLGVVVARKSGFGVALASCVLQLVSFDGEADLLHRHAPVPPAGEPPARPPSAPPAPHRPWRVPRGTRR